MDKEEAREKLTKIIKAKDFVKECESLGFTVCANAEENKSKKKANL